MGEVTPLVSRTNAEWQPASAASSNHDMQQRRRIQQISNNHQVDTHHRNGFYHNSPQSNDDNDEEYTYEFVPNHHQDTKKGNRPSLQRRVWQSVHQLWSQAIGLVPIVRGQVRARTADCQDDARLSCSPLDHGAAALSHDGTEYYEDTFNDESWACSMGTREAVRFAMRV